MEISFEDILNYKNPAVVKRFQKDFPEKAQRAEDIFRDLMRFFWGTKKHATDRAKSPKNTEFDFV